MTDNDIIKALKKCIEEYNGKATEFAVLAYALDLINRQKAEIERYEKENNENFNKWMLLDERTKERYAELYEEAKGVVRAEAIKEFAERLKAKTKTHITMHIFDNGVYKPIAEIFIADIIDNLVKEMTGGDE